MTTTTDTRAIYRRIRDDVTASLAFLALLTIAMALQGMAL